MRSENLMKEREKGERKERVRRLTMAKEDDPG